MKMIRLKRIIFLFLLVNFSNTALAQYVQWLTTDPVCFHKSLSALDQEKLAKKYHLESVELTDYKGKLIKDDTLFDPARLVYSMTFTSTGNILTEIWPGAVTHYYYNTNDLLYKISFPSGDSTLLYYNTNKNLVYTKRYSSDTLFWGTVYTYDQENRLIGSNGYRVRLNKKDGKFIPQDSVYCGSYDWIYDASGRLVNLRQDTPMDITKSALFSYEYLENGNIKVLKKHRISLN
jgi:hypothetical protein